MGFEWRVFYPLRLEKDVDQLDLFNNLNKKKHFPENREDVYYVLRNNIQFGLKFRGVSKETDENRQSSLELKVRIHRTKGRGAEKWVKYGPISTERNLDKIIATLEHFHNEDVKGCVLELKRMLLHKESVPTVVTRKTRYQSHYNSVTIEQTDIDVVINKSVMHFRSICAEGNKKSVIETIKSNQWQTFISGIQNYLQQSNDPANLHCLESNQLRPMGYPEFLARLLDHETIFKNVDVKESKEEEDIV